MPGTAEWLKRGLATGAFLLSNGVLVNCAPSSSQVNKDSQTQSARIPPVLPTPRPNESSQTSPALKTESPQGALAAFRVTENPLGVPITTQSGESLAKTSTLVTNDTTFARDPEGFIQAFSPEGQPTWRTTYKGVVLASENGIAAALSETDYSLKLHDAKSGQQLAMLSGEQNKERYKNVTVKVADKVVAISHSGIGMGTYEGFTAYDKTGKKLWESPSGENFKLLSANNYGILAVSKSKNEMFLYDQLTGASLLEKPEPAHPLPDKPNEWLWAQNGPYLAIFNTQQTGIAFLALYNLDTNAPPYRESMPLGGIGSTFCPGGCNINPSEAGIIILPKRSSPYFMISRPNSQDEALVYIEGRTPNGRRLIRTSGYDPSIRPSGDRDQVYMELATRRRLFSDVQSGILIDITRSTKLVHPNGSSAFGEVGPLTNTGRSVQFYDLSRSRSELPASVSVEALDYLGKFGSNFIFANWDQQTGEKAPGNLKIYATTIESFDFPPKAQVTWERDLSTEALAKVAISGKSILIAGEALIKVDTQTGNVTRIGAIGGKTRQLRVVNDKAVIETEEGKLIIYPTS